MWHSLAGGSGTKPLIETNASIWLVVGQWRTTGSGGLRGASHAGRAVDAPSVWRRRVTDR